MSRVSLRDLFDRAAQGYDRARRQLVPCFDEFYGAVLDLLPHDRDDTFSVLDLGAGTGLLSLFIAETFPGAEITLVDVSERMLEMARARFAGIGPRCDFIVADYSQLELPSRYDCVVSALSIHHLAGPAKARLFTRIYAALNAGGVFVNADQVAAPTPALEERYRHAWLAQVRALGVGAADLDAALERMQEDQPSTVADQLAWLGEAGFIDVRCALDRDMFAVLHAKRPAI